MPASVTDDVKIDTMHNVAFKDLEPGDLCFHSGLQQHLDTFTIVSIVEGSTCPAALGQLGKLVHHGSLLILTIITNDGNTKTIVRMKAEGVKIVVRKNIVRRTVR